MSKFSDFWKSAAYYGNPTKRMEQIDILLKEIDTQMQSKVDPTMWRKMLDQKEALEQEREGLGVGHAPLREE